MANINIYNQINEINNKNDLIDFINNLSKDYIDNPEDWETGSIAEYLEHIAGYIEDNDEMSFEPIEWNITGLKLVARLLFMGKIYE